MFWGHVDDPTIPHGVAFEDIKECITFLIHRYRLFKYGAEADPDALAYMLMAIETAVLRKKIPMAAVREQFAREYGDNEVEAVVGSIEGEVYTRRRDGKSFKCSEIPNPGLVVEGMVVETTRQLKSAGRFPDLLDKWKPKT